MNSTKEVRNAVRSTSAHIRWAESLWGEARHGCKWRVRKLLLKGNCEAKVGSQDAVLD